MNRNMGKGKSASVGPPSLNSKFGSSIKSTYPSASVQKSLLKEEGIVTSYGENKSVILGRALGHYDLRSLKLSDGQEKKSRVWVGSI